MSGLDPARLLELARRHRLEARIGARWAAAAEPVPAWAEAMVRGWQATLGDQVLAADTLAGLGAGAERAGMPLLLLKGADLAGRIYGPGERPSNDIDLLVPASRLEDALALLSDAGFTGDHPDPGWARAHWFALTVRHRLRPRLQVDLHWGLGPRHRTRWPMEDVLGRSEPVPGQAGLRRLDALDLASYLAQHAVAFHAAAGRWIWWLDLWLLEDALVGREAELRARARSVGARVALEAAGRRASELFGAMPRDDGSWRARVIAWAGRRFEDHDAGRWLRWPVAALAVDRARDLVRVAGAVVSR